MPNRGKHAPHIYDPKRHPALAAALAAAGKTEAEMRALLGVHAKRTFQLWKAKYPEFAEALRSGKEPVDDSVEASLLKRALGYEYEETEADIKKDADGRTKSSHIKKIKKVLAPDVTACIFWLKNRRPAEWRDTQKFEHSGNLTLFDAIRTVTEAEASAGADEQTDPP
jgi:hypothetical protein